LTLRLVQEAGPARPPPVAGGKPVYWWPRRMHGGVRAYDSLLEGTGFEPSVPRERLVLSFSFAPTFPLARVNRPDPISESILRPCGQGARPCRHHRRDHPNGLLHQQ